ncbi:acyl-CoA dehydrogenase [Uliginosibacterium sp. H1]|uniref:acyl-CoA dehydrogenase n=1 Tax=Uliginosibacterium sp. H1 TaxID=3114757 RepID=UPI002E190309|nr:acyl-CoA dehydrogenase [Uliginosibacterium sp. H1]
MASSLRALLVAGLGRLPLPGSGQTLQRWRALIKVGSVDLALLKLYEAHTDAHAILAELGGAVAMRDGELWGVWCAEPPDGRVNMIRHADGMVSLHGTKRWCSGAGIVDQGLVSAWNEAGEQCLVAVPMHQPGVRVNHDGWNAVGMVATQTSNIHFSGALGTQVGAPAAYVERPGFWQGGAGIAACWFGGASGIAQALLHSARLDVHGLARLGQCEVALHAAAALLREAAAAIDADPHGDARHVALRARLGVETAASAVIAHASLALGSAPLCNDSRVARLVADLPIYLRQSHGDRDFAALGTQLRDTSADPEKEPPWMP